MWTPLPGQAAQLDAPSAAATLALSGLWPEQGWNGALPPQQHMSPVAQQRGLEGGSPQLTWSSPSAPEGPHPTAAAKIYVQGLPQSLQHPVAVAGLFSPFGDVLDVKLYAAEVRLSGGSAVVRMRSCTQAATAIAALNGVVPDGGWQQLMVRAAETAEQRSSRITAINGRQAAGPGMGLPPPPGSPMQPGAPPGAPLLPPGAGGAALRRVHSARGGGSHGSLQCYTGGVLEGGGGGSQRPSLDWAGRDHSMDSSRRSSIDVARCPSAPYGRTSSDSGSGGDGSGGEEPAGGEGGVATGPPPSEAQRMLLEAVLALLGQVEGGQLPLASMRAALESALAASQGPLADQPQLLHAHRMPGGRRP